MALPFTAALDPQLISTRAATVDIELAHTPTRGVTTPDWSCERKANALIGVDVDAAAFFEDFIERVAPFARGLA